MLRSHRSFFVLATLLAGLSSVGLAAAGNHQTFSSSTPGLTLKDAVNKALSADPRLAASGFNVQARAGSAKQSKAFPNPEMVLEVENFEGSGNFRGLNQAEVTGTLEQRIELGGKRRHRITAALSGTDVAVADQVSMRKQVTTRTTSDFLNLLGAEARLRIAQDRVTQITRLLPALQRKAGAGAVSDVDLARGQVTLEFAVIDREREATNLQAAKSRLVSNWSGRPGEAARIVGKLKQPSIPNTSFEALANELPSHPIVARWAAVKKQKQADFEFEMAQRVPDLTLGAGARQIRETDDTAFLFSLSLPIPVWDRNRGAIEEARHLLARADAEQRAAEQDLFRQLNEAYRFMTTSCGEARRLQSRIIASAGQTVSELEKGYEQGRFGILDLLDASSTLADAKRRQVDSLVRCHASAAEIEYLTGINPLLSNLQEAQP